MSWIIGILTFVLVLDCLFLILLVLVQLPKKEAGLGQAFGGGATDALFGAGSGNALTKMTKYATACFFVLALSLSILNAQHARNQRARFPELFQKTGVETPPPAPQPIAPATTPGGIPLPGATPGTGSLLSASETNIPVPVLTNVSNVTNAAKPATNGAPAPAAPKNDQ